MCCEIYITMLRILGDKERPEKNIEVDWDKFSEEQNK